LHLGFAFPFLVDRWTTAYLLLVTAFWANWMSVIEKNEVVRFRYYLILSDFEGKPAHESHLAPALWAEAARTGKDKAGEQTEIEGKDKEQSET
jgi:hypothetical protein